MLCDDLQWAGLQWDEGPQVGGQYGPYKQSERTQIYQDHATKLLESGSAYRCFCTPQTTGPGGSKTAYVTSGCYQDCSSLSHEIAEDRAVSSKVPFTVRLKRPDQVPKRGYTDLIHGKIKRPKRAHCARQADGDDSGIDAADTILIKSDGTPTYHFANVVDDHLMQITHVIRGSEWMTSTPLHYDLYSAFGWRPPLFAHVGLLLDKDKAKLSKRSSTGLDLDVKGMREQQVILPQVLCNFLVLLGWSNPGKSDVLEMNELIRGFDLKFTKGNAVVQNEKLWYLQKQHVVRICDHVRSGKSSVEFDGIVREIRKQAQTTYPQDIESRFGTESELDQYCAKILLVDSQSYQTPHQHVERNRYFFSFDPAEVTHSDSFADGASAKAFTVLTRKMLESFDFKQTYREPVVSTKPESTPVEVQGPLLDIERTSKIIHAAINHSIWRALANPMWLMLPADKYLEAVQAGHAPPVDQELEYVPFTSKPLDLEAFAKYLGDKAVNPQITTTGVGVTVKAHKEWNNGMMKYLREKLSYGLPGPGVGQVMALLGYKECCKRLGITPQEGGGW